jgi:hypothetical protein
MKTREEILAMTPAERLAYAREWKAEKQAEIAEQFRAEVAAVEARKGELPTKPLDEIDELKKQIEQARIDRQAAKETLVALRDTEQAKRAQLLLDLDAAVGKAAKDPIRLAIDECVEKLAQARADLDAADVTLESLRLARDEALFEERLAKQELLAEDAARVAARKERQATEVAERKAWLAKRKA